MEFKGNRINPLNGIKRIFGMQGVIERCKSIAKWLLLGTIGYLLIARSLPAIMTMASSDLNAALGMAGRSLGHAMLALAGGLVVIALIDVPAPWFQRNKKLMMTKQEVKEEMRQSGGHAEPKPQPRHRPPEI